MMINSNMKINSQGALNRGEMCLIDEMFF